MEAELDPLPDIDASLEYARNPVVKVGIWALYGVMSLLSVSGNLLVIVAISLNDRLRTGSNMMVLSLAVADIVYCASGMIFTPLGLMTDSWLLGVELCKAIPMLASVSVHVISLTTMAIAIDRNLRTAAKRCSLHTHTLVAVDVAIWLVSAAFSVPIAIHTRMEDQRCMELWDEEHVTLRRAYTMFCLILQFVVPAVVITCCYIRMVKFFRHRYLIVQSRSFVAERRRMLNELKRKKSISKLSLAIIVSFIILFIPLNTFNLVAEYNVELVENSRYSILFFTTAHLITSACTVVNPILYGCFNTTFQRFLKRTRLFSKLFNLFEPPSSANTTIVM